MPSLKRGGKLGRTLRSALDRALGRHATEHAPNTSTSTVARVPPMKTPMSSTKALAPTKGWTPSSRRTLQLARGRESFEVSYDLVRARRRSIAIQAVPEGIRVRAPRWTTIADVEQFMRAHQEWIAQHLAACRANPAFAWIEGAQLPLLGHVVIVTGVPDASGGKPKVALHGNRLEVPRAVLEPRLDQRLERGMGSAGEMGTTGDLFAVGTTASVGMGSVACRKAVLKWIQGEARALFRERIAAFAQRLEVAPPTVRLSSARTRWGSCSHGARGARISLHWKLYLLPPELIDYVVAHEIAHLRELNHSARFWAEVERLYPQYRAARVELNRLGRALPRL